MGLFVIPVIPLLASTMVATGGVLMTWYKNLDKQQRKQADKIVLNYLGISEESTQTAIESNIQKISENQKNQISKQIKG